MAQLKSTTVSGDLEVSNKIFLQDYDMSELKPIIVKTQQFSDIYSNSSTHFNNITKPGIYKVYQTAGTGWPGTPENSHVRVFLLEVSLIRSNLVQTLMTNGSYLSRSISVTSTEPIVTTGSWTNWVEYRFFKYNDRFVREENKTLFPTMFATTNTSSSLYLACGEGKCLWNPSSIDHDNDPNFLNITALLMSIRNRTFKPTDSDTADNFKIDKEIALTGHVTGKASGGSNGKGWAIDTKLGNILGSTASSTSGGFTVTLSQDANKKLNIGLTGSADVPTSVSSADKLNSDAGSTSLPVYFTGGKPAAITDLTLINGHVQALAYLATSDRRLKENIKDYSCKKSILDLPIKEFDYKNSDIHTIGCIAQDLQEICPEIVKEDEKGYLHIEESKLVYLLLDEVRSLKKEIEELKRGK